MNDEIERKRKFPEWLWGCLSFAALLLMCSPFMWCFLTLYGAPLWNDFRIQQSFRVYPGAQQIASTEEFVCCDSGAKTFYYETNAPIEDVRAYYETFTLPFIDNETMFHPSGGTLQLGDVPYPITPELEIDLTVDRQCHFSQKWTCVQIDLADLAGELPESISPELNAGTLIIYKYFVETDLNPFFNY